MKVRLTPAAEADVADVRSWYAERGQALAEGFLGSLDECLTTIGRHPRASQKVHGELRRALLRRFPYCVFYLARRDEVVVLGCFHGHRDPRAWKSRRGESG